MVKPVSMTVEAGLAAEQALLAAVCAGEQEFGLLFWQPSDQALVMPRRLSRLPAFETASQVSSDAGWPVLLRETGGEPVPQSSATVNIALVYAPPRSEGDQGRIETGYQRLCQPICDFLIELGGAMPPSARSMARFATVATTSTSMAAKWSVRLNVGDKVVAARWGWCTGLCCWITIAKR